MTTAIPTPQVGHEPGWRIGQLARRLDLTARTLRYWEQLELVPPARRSAGGFRTYGPEHARAARGVVLLKEAGLRLDEIRRTQAALGRSHTARAGLEDVDQVLEEQERRLARRIEMEVALLAELRAARCALEHCTGCNGKVFDNECMDCLTKATRNSLPDALVTVLSAAVAKKRRGESHR